MSPKMQKIALDYAIIHNVNNHEKRDEIKTLIEPPN